MGSGFPPSFSKRKWCPTLGVPQDTLFTQYSASMRWALAQLGFGATVIEARTEARSGRAGRDVRSAGRGGTEAADWGVFCFCFFWGGTNLFWELFCCAPLSFSLKNKGDLTANPFGLLTLKESQGPRNPPEWSGKPEPKASSWILVFFLIHH